MVEWKTRHRSARWPEDVVCVEEVEAKLSEQAADLEIKKRVIEELKAKLAEKERSYQMLYKEAEGYEAKLAAGGERMTGDELPLDSMCCFRPRPTGVPRRCIHCGQECGDCHGCPGRGDR